jgi:hypothetical protein
MAHKSAAPIQKVCPTNVQFQKKASNIDLKAFYMCGS